MSSLMPSHRFESRSKRPFWASSTWGGGRKSARRRFSADGDAVIEGFIHRFEEGLGRVQASHAVSGQEDRTNVEAVF